MDRLQGRRGPRILQPYFDLWKSFGKETLAPTGVGPFFLAAPVISFACYHSPRVVGEPCDPLIEPCSSDAYCANFECVARAGFGGACGRHRCR